MGLAESLNLRLGASGFAYDRDCTGLGHRLRRAELSLKAGTAALGPRCGLSWSPHRVGSKEPFDEARAELELAGIVVNTKQIERISEQLGEQVEAIARRERRTVLSGKIVLPGAVPKLYVAVDGTGVPMVPRETQRRAGKDESGLAKTREGTLGCVFTQTALDEDGYPVRDPGSTTYVGAIEAAQQFGERIFTEAIRRGLRQAVMHIVLGDGAPWIWNIAAEHFPGAIEIADLYHAREHLQDLAKILYSPLQAKPWADQRIEQLDAGDIEGLASPLCAACAPPERSAKTNSGRPSPSS